MLKPKRKIARKEIKVDPVLETVANVKSHFDTHKKKYSTYGTGLVIAIAAIVFFFNNNRETQSEANAAVGRALVYWDSGDLDNAEFQFQLIADEYGSTKFGKLGYYYLGMTYDKKGNTENAKESLETFVADNDFPMLEANARTKLADLYTHEGDVENAISQLRRVEKIDCPMMQKNSARVYLAELLYETGSMGEAQLIAEKVLEEEKLTDSNKNKAQELLGRFNG